MNDYSLQLLQLQMLMIITSRIIYFIHILSRPTSLGSRV